jgi:Glycosyltransferases involved in cell wall biogenesis
VVIPAYNAEKYIEKCIDSVVSQTYSNIEIIVADNGSCDNTTDLLKKYKNIALYHEEKKGVANARNCALSHATGDYILFLDSDDYYDNSTVETLMNIIREKKADILRFRINYTYPNGKNKPEKADLPNGLNLEKKDFPTVIYRNMMTGIKFNSVCRCMYRAELIKEIRFDTTLETAEDLLFNLDAFTKAKHFFYCSDVFYNYTQTGAGLTGRNLKIIEKYRCNAKIATELLKHLPIWGVNTMHNRVLVRTRLLWITLSKIRRILFR